MKVSICRDSCPSKASKVKSKLGLLICCITTSKNLIPSFGSYIHCLFDNAQEISCGLLDLVVPQKILSDFSVAELDFSS